MAISTGSVGKALMPGVNAWTHQSYNEHTHQYKEIFDLETSIKNFEEDVSMSGLGLAEVRAEGGNVSYDDFKQHFVKRYVHIEYSKGFILTRNHIEDNLYAELAEKRSKMIGRSMRETKEHVGANILNRAFNSSYVGADGLELCSLAHLKGKGGTFANELATAADLSEASLEQACIDLMGMEDDAGLKINIMPRKLIVPRALVFEAERILKSTLQNDTANNAVNALKSKGILPDGACVNNYLTDDDAFFIKTDCPDGLKMFSRRAAEIGQDTDFDSDNVKFKATERYSFGWTDPRGIFGSPGA